MSQNGVIGQITQKIRGALGRAGGQETSLNYPLSTRYQKAILLDTGTIQELKHAVRLGNPSINMSNRTGIKGNIT